MDGQKQSKNSSNSLSFLKGRDSSGCHPHQPAGTEHDLDPAVGDSHLPIKKNKASIPQHGCGSRFTPPMFRAVRTRNVGLMQDILTRFHGNIDTIQDFRGNTLISLATINGDHNMIKLLIKKGNVDPNSRNLEGNTPLHIAVARGDTRCIDVLIGNKCDETVQNNDGKTPWEMCR